MAMAHGKTGGKDLKAPLIDRPKTKAILLAITVALAIAGQVLLLNQKHIPGILCYLGALIAFCFATRRNPIAEPMLPEKQEHKFIRAPVLIISAFIPAAPPIDIAMVSSSCRLDTWGEGKVPNG